MNNPIEVIGASRKRLAKLAAIRMGLYMVLPVVATLAIALGADYVAVSIGNRLGYTLDAADGGPLRLALLCLTAVELIALSILAWRAYGKANVFLGTAEELDHLVGAHQEILTLATLADPDRPDMRQKRTPLFPMLWRRVISYLDLFDPKRELRLDAGQPLKRSSIFALATVVVLALATVALMRPLTPMEMAAIKINQIARTLEKSKNPADKALAKQAQELMSALKNPAVPPEQKIAQLEKFKQEIQKLKDESRKQLAQNGKSNGGNGTGQGKGSGKGTGPGTGNGNGNGSGQGSGAGTASNGKGKKQNQEIAELQNDISKAQAQIEMESGPRNPSGNSQGNKGSGPTPKQGKQTNQIGIEKSTKNGGNIKHPSPGAIAQNQPPAGNTPKGGHNDKGSSGNTHLGEFPKAENFARYYKEGKGPPLMIRDARYVTFRLPTEIAANGEGKLVRDTTRLTASTPYTNAPLKDQNVQAQPDEQQLVPPRYRDLIR